MNNGMRPVGAFLLVVGRLHTPKKAATIIAAALGQSLSWLGLLAHTTDAFVIDDDSHAVTD